MGHTSKWQIHTHDDRNLTEVKKILRLLDTYKKYILQKNWSRMAIPACLFVCLFGCLFGLLHLHLLDVSSVHMGGEVILRRLEGTEATLR